MLPINHLLVPQDFSQHSNNASRLALALARKFGAHVHALHVSVVQTHSLYGEPFTVPPFSPADSKMLAERLTDVLRPDRDAADVEGLPELSYHVERGTHPEPAILRYVEDHAIDLIVMGTHGRKGMGHFVLGSVAEKIVRLAPCPVVVVPREATERVLDVSPTLMVPIDFSRHALRSLSVGKALAHQFGARLVLLHVIEEMLHPAFYNTGVFSIYDLDPDIEQKAIRQMHAFYERATGPDGEVDYLVDSGHPHKQIANHAARLNVAMILIATHGLTGIDHLLMGSVTEKVIRLAPCPILTLRYEEPSGALVRAARKQVFRAAERGVGRPMGLTEGGPVG